jgi:hypothetical protein
VRKCAADRRVIQKREDQHGMEDDRARDAGITRSPVARSGGTIVELRSKCEAGGSHSVAIACAWLAELPAGWRRTSKR